MADDDDPLRNAIDELYAADPDEFMERRRTLAAAAKKAGLAPAAKEIAALRKPTRSAYTVNQLTRSDPDRVSELVELGHQLRQAEHSVDAKQIRDLTARRRRLVDELTRRAFEIVEEDSPSSALRDEVVATLTAALADDDVAGQLADGTLVKPARWEGFGFGGSPDLKVVPAAPASHPATRPVAKKGLSKRESEDARRLAAAAEAAEHAAAKAAADQAKRAALADARRAVDDAEEAVVLATDEEQSRLERLKLLEEQVTQARSAVDEARVQLRRAEIRKRRARDALRRLGG